MKKLSFLCVTVFFFSNAFSQDEKFASINQSLLEINPSFAGSNGGIRDQFIYSDQQRRSNKTSFYNGLDGYVKSLRGGLAITLSDENVMSGMLRSTSTNLIYAPRLKCSKSDLIIVPSIQLSYLKRSFDASKAFFSSMLYAYSQTPIQEISSYDKQNFDASAGLLVNYKKLYVGVSFFHINQPDDGLTGSYKLPVKYSFNASYNFVAAKYLLINFQTLYQYQASFNRMQVGLDALFFKHIIVGAGLSVDDKQYLSLGYRHNYFSLLFNYNETPVYKVRAYEICASFNLRNKDNRRVVTNFEAW